ncbi:beta-lactamase-like protein [Baffinella frigidus]|nr:beta-lactamase-like protein [Cryptophyta sp. CCMP2293]
MNLGSEPWGMAGGFEAAKVRAAAQGATQGAMQSRACSAAAAQGSVDIEQFSCLQDNYGFLIHDRATGATAAIDTPEVAPILAALDRRGWKLSHILNTHHHGDHTGGNAELKRLTGCTIVGPSGEQSKIPGIDTALNGGDTFSLGETKVEEMERGQEYNTVQRGTAPPAGS